VCEFCGAQIAAITSVEEELRAFQELCDAATKIANTRVKIPLLGDPENRIQAMKEVRVANYWQAAYIPQSFKAASKMLFHITSQVTTKGLLDKNGAVRPEAERANDVLLQKANAIVLEMRTNGEDANKVAELESEVKRVEAAAAAGLSSARKKVLLMWAIALGFIFYMFSGAFSVFESAGERWAPEDVPEALIGTYEKDGKSLIVSTNSMMIEGGESLDFNSRNAIKIKSPKSVAFEGRYGTKSCSGNLNINDAELVVISSAKYGADKAVCASFSGRWTKR